MLNQCKNVKILQKMTINLLSLVLQGITSISRSVSFKYQRQQVLVKTYFHEFVTKYKQLNKLFVEENPQVKDQDISLITLTSPCNKNPGKSHIIQGKVVFIWLYSLILTQKT